jgi:hypothetical protein
MTSADRAIRIFTLLADAASVSETTDHLRAGPMVREAIRLLQEITGPEGTVELAKTADEIQKAHDILGGILLGETPITLTPEIESKVTAQMDVLCWALGHGHNENFGRNIAMLTEHLRKMGVVLHDSRTGKPTQ